MRGNASGSPRSDDSLFPVSLPIPWEQLVDPVSRMRGDPGENVGKPGLRVDVVHFTRDDEAINGRGALAAAV
jgi:hypothetical protein